MPRRFKPHQLQEAGGFSLVAMIDVLFLLIIFLVLSARFTNFNAIELATSTNSVQTTALEIELYDAEQADVAGQRLFWDELALVLKQPQTEIILIPHQNLPSGVLFNWYQRIKNNTTATVVLGFSSTSTQNP